MSPECQNCGAFVSRRYAAVFVPSGSDETAPRCCPHCPDKIRDRGEVRDARSHRRGTKADD